jgi:hypothetical protein
MSENDDENKRKTRKWMALCILVWGGLPLFCLTGIYLNFREKSTVPTISFEATTVDLGQIVEGDHAQATFRFRNTGKEPLFLVGARTSCGCLTVVEPFKTELMSCEDGNMTVEYDSTGRDGRAETKVYLLTNDPKARPAQLTVVATAQRPYAVIPPRIDFGDIRFGESRSKSVRLVRLMDRSVLLSDLKATADYMRTDAHETEVDRGSPVSKQKSYRIEVTLSENTPLGEFRGDVDLSILVAADSPFRSISIPVTANIVGDVACEPKAIFLGDTRAGDPWTRDITVTVAEGSSAEVVGARSVNGFANIQVKRENERQWCISGSVSCGLAPGFATDRVVIHTNSNSVPVMEIPIHARIVQ